MLAIVALLALSAPPVDRVVVLGDSHSLGPFGRRLHERVSSWEGAPRLELHAYGGSAPLWFYLGTASACGFSLESCGGEPPFTGRCARQRTPLVEGLLPPAEPGARGPLVVVEQGSNLVGDSRGPAFMRSSSARLARTVLSATDRCLWVGPPEMRRFADDAIEAVVVAIRQALDEAEVGGARCRFFDGRAATAYPPTGGDGVHYNFPAGAPIARAWADQVLEAIRAEGWL